MRLVGPATQTGQLISADHLPTLNERLSTLHRRLLKSVPAVDRIACAIYDPASDLLKTFINSTLRGEAISGYEFRLADSFSLSRLAESGECRLIGDIPAAIRPDAKHSAWLLRQGYRTSFTAPLYDNDHFIGLLFFNSLVRDAFSARMQVDLGLFSSLVNLTISSELAGLRAITASAHIAREFTDLRDFETGAHLDRMALYSRAIAKEIAARRGLSDEFVEHVCLFAPLHDLGKIGIPDRILLKPGPLDPDERREMELHVEKGIETVTKILADLGLQTLPDASIMRNIVAAHHEFLDGSGYPNHLRGEDVPIEARIVTVADIYDALTSRRSYKTGWSVERACAELRRMVLAGKLDPDCVQAVEDRAVEFTNIATRHGE